MRALPLLLLAAGVPACAQITCTLIEVKTSPTYEEDDCFAYVHVRMLCTGGTVTPAGQPVPEVNITLYTNAPAFGSTIYVDMPKTENRASLDVRVPDPDGVGGDGLNYSNGSVPNTFPTTTNTATSTTWTDVPFDPSPKGRTVDFTLYVNFCKTNGSSSFPFKLTIAGKIVAENSFLITNPQLVSNDTSAEPIPLATAPATYTVTPSSLDLGDVLPCWEDQIMPGSAPANVALNTGLLNSSPNVPSAASATLLYNTLFPSCLWIPATGYQDNFNQFYDNELGFTFPGSPSPLANFGTELQAVFNNVPSGVSVFVQTSASSPAGTIMLTSPGTALGTTGLTEIPVTNGSATAIWEAQTADVTQTGAFKIPVYFAYPSGVAAPSNITVVQSLASPPGGVQFLQPPANLLQPVVFSINTGASTTPKLTATIDSRPCIVGITFWTNNACSPGNGLLVSVVSDTGPVNESPAFTSAGGVTFFALACGSTPALCQIFPKAANATPGVYPETMTISGVGSAAGASVTVPFTVTVLAPNNPVFELNAVFDAFSYQSETIAPGQIYTIFGSNFGPAKLVYGAFDSGKLATNVANTQVMFDDIASPLIYVANGQISGVAPFELARKTSTNVRIVSNGLTTPTVAVPVVEASISVVSADGSGGNQAVVINKDGTPNSPTNPASAGDEVVIYAAYGGAFANGITGTDGRTTTGPPYPEPAGSRTVSMGGVAATDIPFFASAPGFLESILQINVVIPAGVPSSPYNALVISAGGVKSTDWTTIAVR
jgi:uncharacterized protein (TIGR03437 family)